MFFVLFLVASAFVQIGQSEGLILPSSNQKASDRIIHPFFDRDETPASDRIIYPFFDRVVPLLHLKSLVVNPLLYIRIRVRDRNNDTSETRPQFMQQWMSANGQGH